MDRVGDRLMMIDSRDELAKPSLTVGPRFTAGRSNSAGCKMAMVYLSTLCVSLP